MHEDTFLKETLSNVLYFASQSTEAQPVEVELCKERLGDVKNQLLESVKQRWIRPGGRRDSIGSINSSKRDRDDDISSERMSRQRTISPPQ